MCYTSGGDAAQRATRTVRFACSGPARDPVAPAERMGKGKSKDADSDEGKSKCKGMSAEPAATPDAAVRALRHARFSW